MTTRWLPPLDVSQFEGSRSEMNRFSARARQIRALVETYDPARQAVIVYRDELREQDVVGIVDIVPQH